MKTKHEQILAFIEALPVGEKLSVRLIAKELNVSEGTAYRAIKEADNVGLVSTIQRVGTIRIESKSNENIENLTYKEIVKIIDGEVHGGSLGLDKTLTKFMIGAMTEEAMLRYISEKSLMIVGNRDKAQELSLQNGAAVLITGGFEPSSNVIQLANQKKLPLISTSYDTFTVGTMINRAMTDQLIKKEILQVHNIYTPIERTQYLKKENTVYTYRMLNQESKHSRFPVVLSDMRLAGIVTAKDVVGQEDSVKIEKVMTRNPDFAKKYMSVASIAHTMIWDGLEVMPVVSGDMTLLGIISRQDIMKAMQTVQKQPQSGDTIADQINQMIRESVDDSYVFQVTPQSIDSMGTISFGVLSEVITESVYNYLSNMKKKNLVVEQMNLHYFNMIHLGNSLKIKPHIFDENRRSARLDVEVFSENELAAKAMVVCQLIQKK
ncbi:MAG: DRTGG domain-containing protein [Alkalibacterium gilvum]|uniref:Predicted transcriptional regulator containing CBS domains n=1 Tax=Alkalibacterium gilvum TaxID=1130080 RepID=A0A1H6UFL8_9LACT|nr:MULTISPECIES: DRTGG domain-containing protein [Alkalibacterium]MDN6293254.1 CBS domain-containing protein [Alkalibacterium sp.]MDN6294990.1 CBS domain-containing protein [Alkalibacterium sp.]MDN6398506.1 CBS domain-containing protein [Alkalibacterium sp.]MDN6728705.1 CBS domain-containing protein [Alkalibacterium sp.]SEI91111.1 Predicted transcriptional regulator containing CBS domains [Alkalibacterium gilvum]